MKKFIFLIPAIFAAFALNAQTMREDIVANPNLAGGIYTAYMVTKSDVPAAPKGYKPFYISHYGRHGSRYQTAPEKYEQPLELFAFL